MGRMKTTAPLLFALAAAGCAGTVPLSGDMEPSASLAAAETAFAAHSVREDMRVAFLAAFAPDGVYVRSGWVNAIAWLKDQPTPPIVLDWRPAYVETALSGDFGLSTGPWKITSKAQPSAAPSYGQFVSIWRREGKAPWKVAVDLGIGHPRDTFWNRPLETVVVRNAGSPVAGGIGTAEARFARDASHGGARSAYRKAGASTLRYYRDGTAPAVGLEASLASAAMDDAPLAYRVDRIETAGSGDLGFARGSFASPSAPTVPLGYFMRVWRMEAGEWKVALDVANPAPK
jgi:ketosteroid isomerase-like protein